MSRLISTQLSCSAVLLSLFFSSVQSSLTIYSGSVYPPTSPYTYLLSGNTLFDTVYSTFNSTGVFAIGGILLAAGAIFALRAAPDTDEIKYELENIKNKIKSKPLPFLNGKKKPSSHQLSYSAPVYTPTTLSTYGAPGTTKPITFSFDTLETQTKRQVNHDDDFISSLTAPTLGIQKHSRNKNKIYINLEYPSHLQRPTTSQVIEPLYNEVQNTLDTALSKYDYIDRLTHRNTGFEDDYEEDDDARYYPTMPPIYPRIHFNPERRYKLDHRNGRGTQRRGRKIDQIRKKRRNKKWTSHFF